MLYVTFSLNRVKVVEKQTEHKFGALWGLNMAILNIDLLLQKEQEQIETAFIKGIECGVNNEYVFEDLHAKNYFTQTFKNH